MPTLSKLLKRSRKRAEAKATLTAAAAAEAGTGPADANDAPAPSETAQGAAEPFAELASWSVERLAKWILPRSADELRALDEAAAALPEPVCKVVEARIAEAYTLLARGQLADIAEAKLGDKADPAAKIQPDEDLAAWRARLTDMGMPVDGLHNWNAAHIQNWIFNHPSVEALQALDELPDTLTGVRRARILKEIATAYAKLASATVAGITIEVAQQRRKLADELWDRVERTFAERGYTMEEAEQAEAAAAEAEPADEDLTEEKAAIIEAIERWKAAYPDCDEILELVEARKPGYFTLEDLGAAFAELQQEGRVRCEEGGFVRLATKDEATDSDQSTVTMLPTSTGTVIAHIRQGGAERYALQSGAYKLEIELPKDAEAVRTLVISLLAAVRHRLLCFEMGPFPHPHTTAARQAVYAASCLLETGRPYTCDELDQEGPGGALHLYRCNGIIVQFQRGARGEPDSVAGVLDPDVLEVCKHILYEREMPWHDGPESIAHSCLDMAIRKLTERVTERIGRGVFGKNAA